MASLPQNPAMFTDPTLQVDQKPARVLIGFSSPMECQLLMTAVKGAGRQIEIVDYAVTKEEILRCVSRGNIDVALINSDLEDGRLSGLQALSEICATYQRTPVVMLFDTWQDDLIVQAFTKGAKGVFCRSEKQLDMLWKCISAVSAGQVWANSEQLLLLLNALRSVPPIRMSSTPGLNLLAARESQVAELVAEGLPNKGVAEKLGISEHTVSNYLFRIYNKLGISNRVELVLYVKERQSR
jgi:DNA-binding NarL/FixJ family response regulator